WIVLDQVFTLDRYRAGCSAYLEGDIQVDRHDGMNVDILNERTEPTNGDCEVVGVEGHVGKLKVTGSVGGCRLGVLADRILYGNRGSRENSARRIGDDTAKEAGVRLCVESGEDGGKHKNEKDRKNNARRRAHRSLLEVRLIFLGILLGDSSLIRLRSVPVAEREVMFAGQPYAKKDDSRSRDSCLLNGAGGGRLNYVRRS